MDVYTDPQGVVPALFDQVRRIAEKDEVMTFQEATEILKQLAGGMIYDAYAATFGAEHIDPDKQYRINHNWFADLVALTQTMSGTAEQLGPNEILDNLSRVIFIPQARATSAVEDGTFESGTWIKNPVYQSEQAAAGFDHIGSFTSATRAVYDAPVKSACYEAEASTSLAGTLEVDAGEWVLATVTARSEITCPEGWTVIKETPTLNSNNLEQRMAFLCRKVDAATIVTFTAIQAEEKRMYVNLIAFSGIGGFAANTGDSYITNEEKGKHIIQKPEAGTIVWGLTGNLWSSGTWECGEISANPITLASGGRQANFYDTDPVGVRTFVPGTTYTACVADYVKVLPA